MDSSTGVLNSDSPQDNSYFRKMLLNPHIDELARITPDAVWAEIPKSNQTYDDGFIQVTYPMFANAINGAAHWLKENFGESTEIKALAYFGPWDIRYIVLLLGAVKAGFKMIFPSPLYTTSGLRGLLEMVDCKKILFSHPAPPVVLEYSGVYAEDLIEVPKVSELLDKEHAEFEWHRTFEEAQNEPLVVLHTSGTTSDPKPMTWTHGWAASFIQQNLRKPPPGFASLDSTQQGVRYMSMLPVFHCGNLFGNMLTAISTGSTVIFPLPTAKLTAESFIEALKHTRIDTAVLPPRVLEGIAAQPQMLELVSKKLKYAAYAGGAVSRTAGERMSAATNFFCIYACTENGVFPTLYTESTWTPDSWDQVRFHDKAGVEFRHLGEDSYEAVVVRNADPDDVQPVFQLFPNLTEWRTKDVLNPAGPGAWTYRSRADDVLHFSSRVSFNPVAYEDKIREHPAVDAALMFGHAKPFAVLLVSMKRHDPAADQSLDLVWSHIEAANLTCPEVAKIGRNRIIFVEEGRPLPRAYKGTLQRAPAMRLYEQEIDALYSV